MARIIAALPVPAVVLLLLLAAASSGCDRPLVVRADPTGTEKLALHGDGDRRGTLSRSLKIGEKVVPKGTPVVVEETWLLRKREGARAGYRVLGLYDPAVRKDGLVLPAGAVDVFFYAAILPERRARLPVPQEAFAPAVTAP